MADCSDTSRAPLRVAIALTAALVGLATGCDPGSGHGLILHARTEADVSRVRVVVIYTDGSYPVFESLPLNVQRDASSINLRDPIIISVGLPGPGPVALQLRGEGPASGEGEPARLLATRCYEIQGVTYDTVLLAELGAGEDPDGDFFVQSHRCLDPGEAAPDGLPIEGLPCDFACPADVAIDCAASDPSIHPAAAEICADDVDQDCDGEDAPCEDRDGDGHIACALGQQQGSCDCHDGNPNVHPDADEICGNGVDENCNGPMDELCDRDGDGVPADLEIGGSPDCDDTNPAVGAGFDELCDELDNNCNGLIDEISECTGDDLDRDGVDRCVGGATTGCDCDDCNAGIGPGATERCGDGIDQDCDGVDPDCDALDSDGDGSLDGDDCEDSDPLFYPGSPFDRCGDDLAGDCIADRSCDADTDGDGWIEPELCEGNPAIHPGLDESGERGCNGVDDDCDGVTDEGEPSEIGDAGCVVGDSRIPGCGAGSCAVDYASSPFHCGGCRINCAESAGADRCLGGVCDCSGEPGTGACTGAASTCCPGMGGGCVSLASDLDHCGACGAACGAGADSCIEGSCSCGSTGAPCADGQTCCGGRCIDTRSDDSNCGACGFRCGGNSRCAAGLCQCTAPYADCNGDRSIPGGDGCETNTDTSVSHCGSCGNRCSVSGGTAICRSGACELGSCGMDLADCDGNAANGCETPLNTNSNCGACGTACSRANASASCSTGSCRISSCSSGWGNCDGNDANGCETSLTTAGNCGGCGITCNLANASSTCSGGACAITSCNAGRGDCDGVASNGCETSLTTIANCGMCGVSCSRSHASTSCTTGSCQLSSCNSGWGNCDGSGGNGCETPLTSLTNCGMCGVSCSHSNATSSCSSGSCQLSSCNAGWQNCDGAAGNGCETNTSSDASNCGMCGNTCSFPNATAACSSGACRIDRCVGSFDDCNGDPSDGCEADLDINRFHCGMCGNRCPIREECNFGVCECPPGEPDCIPL